MRKMLTAEAGLLAAFSYRCVPISYIQIMMIVPVLIFSLVIILLYVGKENLFKLSFIKNGLR